MIYIWRNDKTYPGFGLWTIGNLVAAAGYFSAAFRDFIPASIAIFGTTFVITSFALHLEGIRKFHNLSSRKVLSLSIVLLNALFFLFFAYVNQSLILRITSISTMMALICAFCGVELIRNTTKATRYTHWLTAGFFLINSLLMLSRAILTYSFSDIQFIYQPDSIQTTIILLNILCIIGWSFCFVLLNSERLQEDLLAAQVRLEKLATTDFLTGINNGRHFLEISEDEINRARRFEHPLSVIMFDIDHFKRVNDKFGHATGDKVLAEIAEICRNNLRSVDVLGRLGGEEFGVMLPNTNKKNALNVAESLREKIQNATIYYLDEAVRVTASFGISELINEDKQIKQVLVRADNALYKAKKKGRNKVSSS
jgi:diguanylate cyclase (GGDEF)-like protein